MVLMVWCGMVHFVTHKLEMIMTECKGVFCTCASVRSELGPHPDSSYVYILIVYLFICLVNRTMYKHCHVIMLTPTWCFFNLGCSSLGNYKSPFE